MSDKAETAKEMVTTIKDLMDSSSAFEKQELHQKFSDQWFQEDCQSRVALGKEIEKFSKTAAEDFPKATFHYDGKGGISQLSFHRESGSIGFLGLAAKYQSERFPDPMANCKGR